MIKRVDKRLQAVQCLTGNKIKIIACITMLIDHFSKIFLESIMNDKLFPLYLAGGMSTEQFYGIDAFQKNILNGIGTIAFPLFCLLLSEGFFYTKNRKRYIGGMLAFALISEVPFDIGFFSRYSIAEGTFPFYLQYEHIRQSKQEKLFHEAIFQIGNLNDCGCGTEGGQRAAEALTAFAKTFQERNPHLYVFNMVLHMDEATPHLHVDYIPVATEQTRGLSTRVSMKQALKQQGFTGVGQKQTEWKAWMDREKEVLTEIAQQHEFEIISLGSNRRHMELPEYRAAIQESEAVQEQTAAALQELADMQEKKTELKGEIKSLSGTVAALKAAERVRVDFDTIQPEKTLTGAVKGVTVEQIQQLKKVAMTGAAAKQAVVELKKKNAALEKENAEMQKKIPSTMDRLLEKKNLELLETRNFNLRQENKELKEALEEERSFSDRLLEGIDRVLDMLERHLPKQLLHLVDKARDLLPEHQTYRQEKQHERGHSWGDMSL